MKKDSSTGKTSGDKSHSKKARVLTPKNVLLNSVISIRQDSLKFMRCEKTFCFKFFKAKSLVTQGDHITIANIITITKIVIKMLYLFIQLLSHINENTNIKLCTLRYLIDETVGLASGQT